MTAERSWTECASQVMEGRDHAWFTVQTIVSEIRDRNMKPSVLHMPVNEACRSLRSCLRHHALKDNGKFVRKQNGSLIQYALRKSLRSKKLRAKRPTPASRPKVNMSNGGTLPSPQRLTTPTSREAIVVEIDDPALQKPYRSRQLRDPAPSVSGFLLPSPSLSLLGARRTLSVLCAGEAGRPVRRTRGKGDAERARDHVRISSEKVEQQPAEDARPAVLSPEELCPVSMGESHVAFLKSSYDGSPTDVQGDRVRRMSCEVDPDRRLGSDSSSEGSESDDSCGSSGEEEEPFTAHTSQPNTNNTEMPAYSLIPPTPDSSGHHGNKPLLVSRKTTAVATMATSAGGQRSEVARQISYLLSPSSPLVGENLKVLLGAVAFGALSAVQRKQLMSLLPAVDRQHPSNILPVALGNTFFGSACREWQDHLALGLHGNGGGRCRGDKKGRNHDVGWKDNFFESQWGERLAESATDQDNSNVFFPSESAPTPQLSLCLHSILDSYCRCTPPLPPSPPRPVTPPQSPGHTPSWKKAPPTEAVVQERAANRRPSSRRSSKARLSRAGGKLPRHRHRDRKAAPCVTVRTDTIDSRVVAALSPEKNHVAKPANPSPSRDLQVNKSHRMASAKKARLSAGKAVFLSPLPHKMSYVALVDALHKASRPNQTPLLPPPSCSASDPCPTTSPPTQHSHPVFLDHFSSLASHSLPQSFTRPPSPPPSSLPVSLPLSLYSTAVRRRAALSDHNYTPMDSVPGSLPLSLPRSLLPPSPCVCSVHRLTFCSTCNSLYHGSCSHGNLCPTCTQRQTLT